MSVNYISRDSERQAGRVLYHLYNGEPTSEAVWQGGTLMEAEAECKRLNLEDGAIWDANQKCCVAADDEDVTYYMGKWGFSLDQYREYVGREWTAEITTDRREADGLGLSDYRELRGL